MKIFSLFNQKREEPKKKVVMVIAHNGFRDEELLVPKSIFENNGIKVYIACSWLTYARGVKGASVKPDILVTDIVVQDYEAIIFVGGIGSQEYWNDSVVFNIVKKALDLNKIVAAICIAPVILARAGALKDKKATAWPSETSQLKLEGAICTGKNVEIDGKIITADGPASADVFADAIVNALK